MYRTILLAFDGSRSGHEALKQGADLAELCQANVVIMAVIALDLGVLLADAAAPSDLTEREQAEVKQILREGAEKLRRAGLSVETRIGLGNPAREIGRAASEVGADLIVIGHREQGPLARWWSGSTGTSLLAHTPCSVLVAVAG